jgi:hypothetical protein
MEIYPEGHEYAGRCHFVGSFAIEGDGTLKRFPYFPKEWLEADRDEWAKIRPESGSIYT